MGEHKPRYKSEYECILKIRVSDRGNLDNLYELFLPEVSETDRVSVNIDKHFHDIHDKNKGDSQGDDQVVITVRAKDPVVLRATLNSLTRLLSIWNDLN